MNEETIILKISELLTNDTSHLMAICRRMIRSGAIDIDDPQYAGENNYRLARIVLAAAYREQADYIGPSIREDREMVDNLITI